MLFPLGDTKALAAEDCYAVKNRNPSATSGFYWLNPRCSPQPFRAWCDMEAGEHSPNENTAINGLQEQCSTSGTETLQKNLTHQFELRYAECLVY